MKHCTLLFLVLVVLESSANADNLPAFQAAEKEQGGCVSIPYSSMRSSCRSTQDAMSDRCKIEQRSCQKLSATKNIMQDIGLLTKKIESLRQDRDRLKDELSNLRSKSSNAKDDSEKRDLDDKTRSAESKLSDIESAIRELERRVEDQNKRLEELRTTIRERLAVAEPCSRLRRDVMAIFRDAISKANGESDAQIKQIAQSLVRRWQSSVDNHEQEARGAEEVTKNCEKALRGEL